ncbi:pyridoxamine 5'-phosphate oxidase [Neorhizobium sp. SOG26]|uniref:HugZ family pyridoxamine 5'-phosphate oxidase n=1 Tax=Neorhizobium sp. SOG26 TaxID=2060726 RepID=UPI000E58614D|nr:pyridoxamine 5'-phosphate oxidase family protein [Neorhizobium sp. SOG26]AXV15927.1 pyridoxamine 5'-phosphate oxidase [Neorhizobium sp. SOG26]
MTSENDIKAEGDKPKVIRDTDDEARRLARTLLRGARYMALAVLDPETGFPSVSRVLTGTDIDGVPVILVSALASHTKALRADPRCSLLAGEPGKGDPLAHPRITVQCIAEPVRRETPQHERRRSRFLNRHPKAALYLDFGDFQFLRITPQTAALNAGFGRAYILPGSDLVIAEPADGEEWRQLEEKLSTMTAEAAAVAAHLGRHESPNWRFGGLDRSGFELICGDILLRHEFDEPAVSPEAVLNHISAFANAR